MRRFVQAGLLTAVGVMLTGASVSAATVFATTLSGASEAPANGSAGTGSALVTLAGNTLNVSLTFSGLSTPDVAGHIHCCGPLGVDETVAVPFVGLATGVTAGSFTGAFDLTNAASYNSTFISANGGTASAAEAALIAGLNSGMTYVNIHTAVLPGGEIRGQLGAVPEPATMVLAGSALAALALWRRRRLL